MRKNLFFYEQTEKTSDVHDSVVSDVHDFSVCDIKACKLKIMCPQFKKFIAVFEKYGIPTFM